MSNEKNELAELFTKHLPEAVKDKLKTLVAAFKSEDTKEFTELKTKAEAFITANKDAAKVEAVKVALASVEKDKSKIEDLKVLLAEDPAAPVENYNEAPLADGTILKYTGDLAVGSKCILVTPTGEVPAPEGEHKLADGTTIVVKKEGEDSVISEIKPAEEMKDAVLASIQKAVEATAKDLKDLAAKFSALEKENKSIKAEHEATKLKLSQRSAQLKELGTVVAEMAAISEEPINEPNKNKPSHKLSTVVKSRF